MAGQAGQASGLPLGFEGGISLGQAGDALRAGRLAFFFRSVGDDQALRPLAIANRGPGRFRLEGAGLGVDVEVLPEAPAAALFSTLPLESGESLIGLTLPQSEPQSEQPARDGLRRFAWRGSLSREASYESRIGFYLADRATGSIVDPRTGSFLSGVPLEADGDPDPSYLSTAAAHTLWQGEVGRGERVAIRDRFSLQGDLDPEQLALVPILIVADPSGQKIYGSGLFGNPDRQRHVGQLGNTVLGFEDQFGGGDHDLDDLLLQVNAMRAI